MAAIIRESISISNERFGFTMFVSICFHVVLILGVGFEIYEQMSEPETLEITLAQYRSDDAPEEADFLAQENQSGSGVLEESAAPSTPIESTLNDDEINEINPLQQAEARQALQENPEQTVLTTNAEAQSQIWQQELDENLLSQETPALQAQTPQALTQTIASLQAQLDLRRQEYAKRPRKYTISSASTKQTRDALYLDSWRKKIESVGNLNYPQQASQQGVYGNLRLLVALHPDGKVDEVRVLRSSGHKILDDAAIQIVYLAAPFDAFPASMKREVDILEIIRTWQFHSSNSFSSY